ncbi:MAG: TrbI/VirB10 family protein [Aestuariivita sp.]|nr:TrbI/VirB10 family protein [Aestuariivita sp.]
MTESTAATAATPLPRQGSALALLGIVCVLTGLVIGYVAFDGAHWFRPGEPEVPDIDPRPNAVVQPSPVTNLTEPTSVTTEVATATGTSLTPPAPPVIASLSEEEVRRAERARLASESPLTPAVRDLADMIKDDRSDGAYDASSDTPSAPVSALLSDTPSTADPSTYKTAPTFLLARGSVIPTVLESSIDSALPGLVRARVSETVYDSVTGRHILIPRGAHLVGSYAQATSAGAQRLFVSWSDLRMPDGRPIRLDDFSSLGSDGASGVRGKRSTGLLKAFGAAVLFDLAGNATQILTGDRSTTNQSDLGALIAAATGSATTRVADQYLGQILSGGTRFRVKAGAIMNVLVEEDLTLPVAKPWP